MTEEHKDGIATQRDLLNLRDKMDAKFDRLTTRIYDKIEKVDEKVDKVAGKIAWIMGAATVAILLIEVLFKAINRS